jgi:hypothetical protein
MTARVVPRVTLGLLALLAAQPAAAHSGPPYPVISKQTGGAYQVSLWTDPDATDDGSKGGQFWVVIEPGGASPIAPETRARVSIKPLDRDQPFADAQAEPVDGDVTRQYAALVMDHEGPFAVRVAVDGPSGAVTLDTRVDATYDLRAPLPLLAVYLLPFLAVGFLWTLRLLRRRRAQGLRPKA